MPIYTFTHSCNISAASKRDLAEGVTQIHCEKTGAPAKYVQVVFKKVEEEDAFTGGEPNRSYLTLEGTIRPGRSEEVEKAMLWAFDNLVKTVSNRQTQNFRYFISLGRFSTPWLIENGEMLPAA